MNINEEKYTNAADYYLKDLQITNIIKAITKNCKNEEDVSKVKVTFNGTQWTVGDKEIDIDQKRSFMGIQRVFHWIQTKLSKNYTRIFNEAVGIVKEKNESYLKDCNAATEAKNKKEAKKTEAGNKLAKNLAEIAKLQQGIKDKEEYLISYAKENEEKQQKVTELKGKRFEIVYKRENDIIAKTTNLNNQKYTTDALEKFQKHKNSWKLFQGKDSKKELEESKNYLIEKQFFQNIESVSDVDVKTEISTSKTREEGLQRQLDSSIKELDGLYNKSNVELNGINNELNVLEVEINSFPDVIQNHQNKISKKQNEINVLNEEQKALQEIINS